MRIPCNTWRHRNRGLRTPVLSPIAEALLLDRLGRPGPLPGWVYDEAGEEPEQATFWDHMVSGTLR